MQRKLNKCINVNILFSTFHTFDRTDELVDAGRTVPVTVAHSLCGHTLISGTLELSERAHTLSLVAVVSAVVVTVAAVQVQHAAARRAAELVLSAHGATV